MKKIVYILLLLALFAGFPQAARADLEDGQMIPDAVVKPLMAWVEQETGVAIQRLPTVVASRTKLMDIVSRMGRLAGRPRALYVGGMVIVDHTQWDAEDDTQKSLLVHELVHYAQAQRRTVAGACAQAKEVEAYTLQNKWLEQHDHSPFVTASWIQRMAACPAGGAVVAALAQAE